MNLRERQIRMSFCNLANAAIHPIPSVVVFVFLLLLLAVIDPEKEVVKQQRFDYSESLSKLHAEAVLYHKNRLQDGKRASHLTYFIKALRLLILHPIPSASGLCLPLKVFLYPARQLH